MILLFMLVQHLAFGEEIEGSQLPSSKSLQTIEEYATEPIPSRPGTRARPGDIDEDDNPQKVPLSSPGYAGILILTCITGLYAFSRKNKLYDKK